MRTPPPPKKKQKKTNKKNNNNRSCVILAAYVTDPLAVRNQSKVEEVSMAAKAKLLDFPTV